MIDYGQLEKFVSDIRHLSISYITIFKAKTILATWKPLIKISSVTTKKRDFLLNRLKSVAMTEPSVRHMNNMGSIHVELSDLTTVSYNTHDFPDRLWTIGGVCERHPPSHYQLYHKTDRKRRRQLSG